jgi:hypothetical protein
MSVSVVGVHGIGAHLPDHSPEKAAQEYCDQWWPRLRDGLRRAAPSTGPLEVTMTAAYYAHLLRRPGEQGEAIEPEDLTGDELAILAALVEAHAPIPTDRIQGWPTWAPRQLLSFLTDSLDTPNGRRIIRAACRFAREVSAYLDHAEARMAVREIVAKVLERDQPDVVAAHSLGSVVAYETLWSRQDLKNPLLLTLGSPLALPGAIFDRLEPYPSGEPPRRHGEKLPNVDKWWNVADVGDLVAVPRPLPRRFPQIECDIETVVAGFGFHAFDDYLAAPAVGKAVWTLSPAPGTMEH